MQPFSRADFDAALASAFPNIRIHRKELVHGWTDTSELGWIQLEFTAYQSEIKRNIGGRKPGQIDIKLYGVRPSTGNSTHLLQTWTVTGIPEFKRVLQDTVVPSLMGLAAILLRICGLDTDLEGHQGKPKETSKEDLGESISDALANLCDS